MVQTEQLKPHLPKLGMRVENMSDNIVNTPDMVSKMTPEMTSICSVLG